MTDPIPSEIRCPKCGEKLERVRKSSGSPLNDDQFDAIRAGDWFCKCYSNGRGNTPYAYFWDREVQPISSVSPASEKWDVRDGMELVMTTEIPCEWYGRKVGMFHACVDTSDGSLRCINCKNEFHKPLSPASTKETVEEAFLRGQLVMLHRIVDEAYVGRSLLKKIQPAPYEEASTKEEK